MWKHFLKELIFFGLSSIKTDLQTDPVLGATVSREPSEQKFPEKLSNSLSGSRKAAWKKKGREHPPDPDMSWGALPSRSARLPLVDPRCSSGTGEAPTPVSVLRIWSAGGGKERGVVCGEGSGPPLHELLRHPRAGRSLHPPSPRAAVYPPLSSPQRDGKARVAGQDCPQPCCGFSLLL